MQGNPKTCKVCGDPVWPNRAGLVRCETHYHAYFAEAQRRRYWRIKRAQMTAAMVGPEQDSVVVPPRQGDVCRVCGQPRRPGIDRMLCADHYRAYMRTRQQQRYTTGYKRISGYLRAAAAIGANEEEAWWLAMAAEGAFRAGQSRPYWLRPFLQAELEWLRANAKVLQKLDAHQEVA
jgi:hypothetical protein